MLVHHRQTQDSSPLVCHYWSFIAMPMMKKLGMLKTTQPTNDLPSLDKPVMRTHWMAGTDSECQRPHYNKYLHQTSWTTQHALSSDHHTTYDIRHTTYDIRHTTYDIRHDYRLQQNQRTFTHDKQAGWTKFTEDTEDTRPHSMQNHTKKQHAYGKHL